MSSMTASQILDREFLEIRGKILEIAASLDRLDRADGEIRSDRRLKLLREGLAVLTGSEDNRAERIQKIFSREYDQNWRDTFGLTSAPKAK